MEEENLLNCPFCGFHPDINDEDCIYPLNRERTLWNLVCYETGGGCGASVLGDTKEEVITRWNTRSN
ncbi:MAG: hypothetical protein ACXW2E_01285 [Nitrososphaeraceae archaeon]